MSTYFLPTGYENIGVADRDEFLTLIRESFTFNEVQELLADHSLFAPDPELLAACTYRLATFAREWAMHHGDDSMWSAENGFDSPQALARASRLRAEHGRAAIALADFYAGLLERHNAWTTEAFVQSQMDGQPCDCGCCDVDDVGQAEVDADAPTTGNLH